LNKEQKFTENNFLTLTVLLKISPTSFCVYAVNGMSRDNTVSEALLYHVKHQILEENDKGQNGRRLNASSRNYIYQIIPRYINERNVF
jgi:hypothetical protein